MSYLKLIANAAWSGLYGSFLLTQLILFLNEDLASRGLVSKGSAGVLASCTLVYMPAIAVIYPTLFITLRFFAARRLGTAWVDLKATVWLGAATLLTLVAVFYNNLWWTGALLSPGTRESLRITCVTMAACFLAAVIAACVGQAKPSRQGRWWRMVAGCLLLAPLVVAGGLLSAASPRLLTAPSSVRPAKTPDLMATAAGSGLLWVGIEAASMDFILPLVSARELPTFEAMMTGGASARLNSLRPCASRVAWTVLATGLPPWTTGVTSAQRYELRLGGEDLGVLPRMIGVGMLLRARLLSRRPEQESGLGSAFWEILRAAGASVHVIGWRDLPATIGRGGSSRRIDERVQYRVERIVGEGARPGPASPDSLRRVLREAVAADLAVRDAALAALRADSGAGRPPRLMAVRLPGLGDVSRRFLKYHLPDDFGDVTPQELSAHGKVLTGYYKFLDDLLAELVAAAGPGLPVILVSPHGVEPTTTWERLSLRLLTERGAASPPPSGSWRGGPDGVLMMRGEGIRAGAKLEDADLQDIVPTMLYMLGLPLGRDMNGNLLRRAFEPEYLESHPVRYIPRYVAREVRVL